MKEALNLEGAGKFLGVSPHTLRSWARAGHVPHFRLGRRMVFDRGDLEVFLAANKVNVRAKGRPVAKGRAVRRDSCR